jgi:hypothetical protein
LTCEYHISTSIGYTWAIQIPESGDGGFSLIVIPVCESAERPVRSSSTLASSVVMSGIGQGRNREMSNNLDMREQFGLRYFEIIDTVTGEMKHRSTENDAYTERTLRFQSTQSQSLF